MKLLKFPKARSGNEEEEGPNGIWQSVITQGGSSRLFFLRRRLLLLTEREKEGQLRSSCNNGPSP